MAGNILAYVDHFKGRPLQASWEVVSAARKLAAEPDGRVTALIFGPEAEKMAQASIHYGADEALICEDASLADYRPEPIAALISKIGKEHQPDAIFFTTSTRGRELAAMVAIDLDSGVLPDVINIENQGGKLVATRPIYAGKLLAKVECRSKPQLLTLRVRAFGKPVEDSSRSGKVTKVATALGETQLATKVVDYATVEGRVSLGDAAIIVSGGRGTSNNLTLTPPAEITDEKQKEIWRAQQGFRMVGELAQVLGGALGASRAAAGPRRPAQQPAALTTAPVSTRLRSARRTPTARPDSIRSSRASVPVRNSTPVPRVACSSASSRTRLSTWWSSGRNTPETRRAESAGSRRRSSSPVRCSPSTAESTRASSSLKATSSVPSVR